MHRRFKLQGQSSSSRRIRFEERAENNESKVIRGYGAVFYNPSDPQTEYWLWDDIVERIMPGAFDRVIKESQDVRCLFNHDMNFVLGRTVSGTCRLTIDAVGLAYECDESPKDPQWMSVAEKLNRGDVSGSSFSFVPSSTVWESVKVDGRSFDIRWIKEIGICYDVGPVAFPAYEAATSSRAIEEQERSKLYAERNKYLHDGDDVMMRLREIDGWV